MVKVRKLKPDADGRPRFRVWVDGCVVLCIRARKPHPLHGAWFIKRVKYRDGSEQVFDDPDNMPPLCVCTIVWAADEIQRELNARV